MSYQLEEFQIPFDIGAYKKSAKDRGDEFFSVFVKRNKDETLAFAQGYKTWDEWNYDKRWWTNRHRGYSYVTGGSLSDII